MMYQNGGRKVTKITDEIPEDKIEPRMVPQEQLQREFDYIQAEKMLKRMLEKGLITMGEFEKTTVLNRQTFSPMLARIMP
jgi:hypothetical protein